MRRHLITLVSALSLVLCVGTAVLWVWNSSGDAAEISRFGADLESAKTAHYWHMHLGSHDGGIYWMHCSAETIPGDREWGMVGRREWHHGEDIFAAANTIFLVDFGRSFPSQEGDSLAPDWRRLGFRAFRFSELGTAGYVVVVPDWLPIALAAIAPALWTHRRLRRRRYRLAGSCLQCGYDLRATPGRCPECGAVPTPVRVKA
jgi:hypothetical protein